MYVSTYAINILSLSLYFIRPPILRGWYFLHQESDIRNLIFSLSRFTIYKLQKIYIYIYMISYAETSHTDCVKLDHCRGKRTTSGLFRHQFAQWNSKSPVPFGLQLVEIRLLYCTWQWFLAGRQMAKAKRCGHPQWRNREKSMLARFLPPLVTICVHCNSQKLLHS